jgi:SAM-dependent methyltransferase
MSAQAFPTLEAAKDAIQTALNLPSISAQLSALASIRYSPPTPTLAEQDPFSDGYRNDVLSLYQQISGRPCYEAEHDEKTNALDDYDVAQLPIPYRFRDSALLGEFLCCYGWVVKQLDVRPGDRVLEYGPGEGQLLIHLARMGCEAYAVDVEPRFLRAIAKQCEALDVRVHTQRGHFGDAVPGGPVDRVIFFEAFHHCLNQLETLHRIRRHLQPNGFICFSGEPIIKKDSVHSPCVPYPWGPRLDGEAIRSIWKFGWMELGYSEHYFIDLLMRAGYAVEFKRCPFFDRGDAYLARPIHKHFPILDDTLIATWKGQCGWHPSEQTHRWTDGDAWLPLPQTGLHAVQVVCCNMQPSTVRARFSAGSDSTTRDIASRATEVVRLSLQSPAEYLRIESPTFCPAGDERTLGVAVQAISFN